MPDTNELNESHFITEFPFLLPRGFVDELGNVHRQGTMRLATARDEFKAKSYKQVRQYPDYLNLVMLSLVITELGTLSNVSPVQLEGLFTQDLAYLKTFYSHLNQQGHPYVEAHCSECDRTFEVEMTPVGETSATPPTSSMRR